MIVKSKEKTFFCIIADHLRTVIFALMDGATFEPKGRGYVIRKLVKKIVLLSFFLKFRTDDLILISKKIIAVVDEVIQECNNVLYLLTFICL